MKLRVLLLGGGGRESALAWKLAQSPLCGQLFVAPGNPGTCAWAERMPRLDILDAKVVAASCREHHVDLVFVGPEQPLVLGLVDELEHLGLRAFGPSRLAAELEGSKVWAKAFMVRHGVPTAAHEVFSDPGTARAFLARSPWPVVIKADGLAAGKGVILPDTAEEALTALDGMMCGETFGAAGHQVVIEERLRGPELSVFALCDGERGWILGSARDHKRVGEGDSGPNTGGMGALSPSPLATPELLVEVRKRVLEPVLAGMAQEGRPYRGMLYLGLMLTAAGLRVIEFNCRLGDPETQALLPLQELDLLEWAWHLAQGGRLPDSRILAAGSRVAVSLVLAAAGYPGVVRRGDVIHGLERLAEVRDVHVFQAGTETDPNGELLTAGGRVLCLTAVAGSVAVARELALAAAEQVTFKGMHYRRDIGL